MTVETLMNTMSYREYRGWQLYDEMEREDEAKARKAPSVAPEDDDE